MINYQEFNFPIKAKEIFGKKPFELTIEQLAVLYLLKNKFNLSGKQIMQIEFILTNECKLILQNRFRTLEFEIQALGAMLYILDSQNKDFSKIHEFIDKAHSSDRFIAGSTRGKVYLTYRKFYEQYDETKLNPDEYQKCNKTLQLIE